MFVAVILIAPGMLFFFPIKKFPKAQLGSRKIFTQSQQPVFMAFEKKEKKKKKKKKKKIDRDSFIASDAVCQESWAPTGINGFLLDNGPKSCHPHSAFRSLILIPNFGALIHGDSP